jgi:hypothetical protein
VDRFPPALSFHHSPFESTIPAGENIGFYNFPVPNLLRIIHTSFSNVYIVLTVRMFLPYQAGKRSEENGPFDLFLGNIEAPGYHFSIGIELRAIVLLLAPEPS